MIALGKRSAVTVIARDDVRGVLYSRVPWPLAVGVYVDSKQVTACVSVDPDRWAAFVTIGSPWQRPRIVREPGERTLWLGLVGLHFVTPTAERSDR